MHPTRPAFAILLIALASAYGCSRPVEPFVAGPEAQAAGQTVASAKTSEITKACDLVTAKEMTAILGSDVVAQPNDGSNGKTECIYQTGNPVEGSGPYAELTVEWGSGEAAMTAMGMMGQIEPGIADPYEGIGDQAAAIGPTLMIRSGDDLITIVLSGVDDMPATAKKIFATAEARI
jgi:hypothetical protein